MKYDLATGERTKAKSYNWDIAYAYFSHSGKYQVFGINEDGKTVIEIFETATGNKVDFPDYENGSITSVSISRDEEWMCFYVGSSATPSNLYVYQFADQSQKQVDHHPQS